MSGRKKNKVIKQEVKNNEEDESYGSRGELEQDFDIKEFASFVQEDDIKKQDNPRDVKIKRDPYIDLNNNRNNDAESDTVISSPSNPRKRLNPQTDTVYGDMLTQEYDKIDEYRLRNDFMYSLMYCRDERANDIWYNTLVEMIIRDYPSSEGVPGLGPEHVNILRRIISHKDKLVRQTFWFFALYITPQLFRWMMEGEPDKGIPPPRVASHDRLQMFVRNYLPTLCEKLLNGSGVGFGGWVENVKLLYIQHVGIVTPPPLPRQLPQIEGMKQ